jgi:hypothetical protein
MRRLTFCIGLLLPALASGQRDRDSRSWRVEEQDSLRQSFAFNGNDGRRLLVDNVSGFVHVTGYAGSAVQVSVAKRIRAVNDTAASEAKRDVKLDMNQQGNYVRLYVDGPFRNQNGVNYRGDDYYGYRVSFDMEIQVPFDTELTVKSVNGPIEIKKTAADFTVNGVNGGIDMQEVSGAGTVRTVNGPVKVTFTKNPGKPTEFKSVNGNLDVYFQPGLSADLSFHTLNGGIYTDFDVVTRPGPAGTTENVNGKFLYRVDRRNMNARTGSGGPELKFDTLNGSIRLRSKGI